ncbi:transcriptional regulator FilR1 domain-containing protein [Haloferax mucosum]|uniref:transcriptional regulator FilR1 domain-containing protein n=1 Tax=Haloferax mucosum TaxID=403181 RepID=UPI001F4C8D22|nr:hypothetical protein [Haloferax mucosum]
MASHLSPLKVILSRHQLLEQIDNGVSDKRELYGSLDSSRTTIDRAIRELEEENILSRHGRHCEFTRFGRLTYNYFNRLSKEYEAIHSASELLSVLPGESKLEQDLLDGSDVTLASQRAPAAPFREISGVPDDEPIQALLPILFPQQLQFICERLNHGSSIELVIHRDLITILKNKYRKEYSALRNSDVEIATAARLPQFGLIIIGSQEFWLSVHRESGGLLGLINNTTPHAVKRARKLFNNIKKQNSGCEPTSKI